MFVHRAFACAVALCVLLVDGRPAHAADAERAPAPANTVELVVEGDRVRPPVPARDRSVSGSVITEKELRRAGVQAVDVLRAQPGIQVTESGALGAPSSLSVRGASAQDTAIYLAGVRLNDDVGGTADLSLVPLWLIQRVEIYRGNAPIDADRLGPGGAIFFEPQRPRKTTGAVGSTAGSFGTQKGYVLAGFAGDSARGLLGVSAEAAQNRYTFVDDRGTTFDATDDTVRTRRNADTTLQNGWALGSVDLGRGADVEFLLNGVHREQGVPRLALLPSQRARNEAKRLLASVTARVPFGDDDRHELKARTSALFSESLYSDPLLELALYTRQLSISAQRVEQAVTASIAASNDLTIRPAINLAHERVLRVPAKEQDLSRLFARIASSAEQRVADWLTLHALVSGECHGTEQPNACDVLAPSGRIGAELGSGRTRVLANVGRYLRVPTLGELFGVSGVVHGNSELEPEIGLTAELGIRTQTARGRIIEGFYVDAFVFARTAEKLVAYTRTGQGFVLPYNVGRARTLGAELLTGVALLSFLRSVVSVSLLDARDTTPSRMTRNSLLPFRSRLVVSPRLIAETKLSRNEWLNSLSAELSYTYQSSRYADPAGLGIIAAQGTMDFEVASQWFHSVLEARVRVSNAFNARRTDIIGYPLPGRAAFLTMETRW